MNTANKMAKHFYCHTFQKPVLSACYPSKDIPTKFFLEQKFKIIEWVSLVMSQAVSNE